MSAIDEEKFDRDYPAETIDGDVIVSVPWTDNSLCLHDNSPDCIGFRRFPEAGLIRIAVAGNHVSVREKLERGHDLPATGGDRVITVSPERAIKIALAIIKQAHAMRNEE